MEGQVQRHDPGSIDIRNEVGNRGKRLSVGRRSSAGNDEHDTS